QRDQREGVQQDTHLAARRRRSATVSASRAALRSCPLFIDSSPLRAPRAAAIESSGAGLSTTRSPRSSSASVEVPQRWRMREGIEICPPRVILAILMIMKNIMTRGTRTIDHDLHRLAVRAGSCVEDERSCGLAGGGARECVQRRFEVI